MAATFETPVLLTEVEEGRFRIFRGMAPPPGIALKMTSTLPSFYQITGPFEVYHRLAPPESDVSREDVLAWLEGARKLGCDVKATDFAIEGLRR